MSKKEFSKIGDLTDMANDIKVVFEKHGIKDPAFAIAFTASPDYRTVHWVTNVSRTDGIKLMKATSEKMTYTAN